MDRGTVIVTTINSPTQGLAALAALANRFDLLVVADRKTPRNWRLEGATLLDFDAQQRLAFSFARVCPADSYARKNLGYLRAIANHTAYILETDDDNIPYDMFGVGLDPEIDAQPVLADGWVNVYRLFCSDRVWPRGFPLSAITRSMEQSYPLGPKTRLVCPVQQFLADGDPDVDAIYRMVMPSKDIRFIGEPVTLGTGVYCTFNSQNTAWWPLAYPLLYLPCHVSFRMTDIWRSMVAQVCLHACGYPIAFRAATVYQVRNEHTLQRDFELEVPGYLHNERMITTLTALDLSADPRKLATSLTSCYRALVDAGYIPATELGCVAAWCEDVQSLQNR